MKTKDLTTFLAVGLKPKSYRCETSIKTKKRRRIEHKITALNTRRVKKISTRKKFLLPI
jgi:hypothetical protein